MKIRKSLYQYNFVIATDSTISYLVENTHSGIWQVVSKINSPRGQDPNSSDRWEHTYSTKREAVRDIFQYEKNGYYKYSENIGWGYYDDLKEESQ